MKKIDAIIRASQLEEVTEALLKAGVIGMTTSNPKGYGRQKGITRTYRGQTYTVEFVPKLRLEVIVANELVDPVVALITEAAHTGEIGDGKIFVTPIEAAYRIRTGERNEAAL